MKIKQTTKVG